MRWPQATTDSAARMTVEPASAHSLHAACCCCRCRSASAACAGQLTVAPCTPQSTTCSSSCSARTQAWQSRRQASAMQRPWLLAQQATTFACGALTSMLRTPHARTASPCSVISCVASGVSALARGHSICSPLAAAVATSSGVTSCMSQPCGTRGSTCVAARRAAQRSHAAVTPRAADVACMQRLCLCCALRRPHLPGRQQLLQVERGDGEAWHAKQTAAAAAAGC